MLRVHVHVQCTYKSSVQVHVTSVDVYRFRIGVQIMYIYICIHVSTACMELRSVWHHVAPWQPSGRSINGAGLATYFGKWINSVADLFQCKLHCLPSGLPGLLSSHPISVWVGTSDRAPGGQGR